MKRITSLVLISVIIVSLLSVVATQRLCGPISTRVSCIASTSPGKSNITQNECEATGPLCCFDPLADTVLSCYISVSSTNSNSMVNKLVTEKLSSLPQVDKLSAEQAQKIKDEGGKFSKSDSNVNNKIKAKALNLNLNPGSSSFALLGLAAAFPACPVNPPICQRIQCNAETPFAQENPIRCLNKPECCFDRDMYLYKSLFGPAFLGGAPVCYYGPTSYRYRQIAQRFQPWNPYYSNAIVDIFEAALDTFLNFEQQALCSFTNIFSGSILATPACGWKGITSLECSLKGCCYNKDKNICAYPTEISSLPSNEFYPELIAQYPGDSGCSRSQFPPTFNPNVFRRLPCRFINNATSSEFVTQCPAFLSGSNPLSLTSFLAPQPQIPIPQSQTTCCADLLGLIPELNDFSSSGVISSNVFSDPSFFTTLLAIYGSSFGLGSFGTNAGFPGISGLIPGLGGFGGVSGIFSGLTGFYCPYYYIKIPGFPDLSSKLEDCCKIHPCYIRKERYTPPSSWANWGSWGQCNAPCGVTGQRRKTRVCIDGSSRQPSNVCPGSDYQDEPCQTYDCWTPWTSFGRCNNRCEQIYSRRCVGSNQFPSSSCQGESQITRRCLTACVLPAWSTWTGWSACQSFNPCGTGVQSRNRQCSVPNRCQGSGTEQQQCANACWSEWNQWSACSTNCGQSGQQRRTRNCQGGQINSCPGTGFGSRSCIGPCPDQWTQWGPWSGCTASCGRQGEETRRRSCVNQFQQIVNTCSGSSIATKSCSASCPAQWSNWGPWSGCTTQCGGTNTRGRVCSYSNGANANTCAVDSFGRRETETITCNNCANWSQWSGYGQCNAPCGQSGTRVSSRTCQGSNQQSNCQGQSTRTASCQGSPCFTYGEWNSWSPCSSSCTYTRTRSCRNANNNVVNGRNCGVTTRSLQDSQCTGGSCLPVPSNSWVSWGAWIDYSPCPPCGSGRRSRERMCLYLGNSNNPMSPTICDCFYQTTNGYMEESNCPNVQCPTPPPVSPPPIANPPSYSWGAWISQSCTFGLIRRNRDCIDSNQQTVDDANCPGGQLQSYDDVNCDAPQCNDDWTTWFEWCDCDKDIRQQIRCCGSSCSNRQKRIWDGSVTTCQSKQNC